MKTFLIFNPKLFFGAIFLTLFDKIIFPSTNFLLWLGVCMVVDLLTGLYKAWHIKEKITSKKLRASVGKIIQYAGCVIVVVALANFSFGEKYKTEIDLAVSFVYSFLILIEAVSIFENIKAVNPSSPVSKYIFSPLLKLINVRLKAFQNEADDIVAQPDGTE